MYDNRHSAEKAGVPNHNNGAEGLNGQDKVYMQFERPQVVKHCARMQERIRDRSYFDDSSGTYINSLTWNGPFWKGVHDYLALKVCHLYAHPSLSVLPLHVFLNWQQKFVTPCVLPFSLPSFSHLKPEHCAEPDSSKYFRASSRQGPLHTVVQPNPPFPDLPGVGL